MGQRKRTDWRLAKRLLPFLRPHRLLIVFGLVMAPVLSALAVVRPIFLQRAIDENLVPKVEEGLLELTLLFAGFLVLETLCRVALTYSFQLTGARVMKQLRVRLFSHVLKLRSGYFDVTPVGRTLTRITSDVEALNEFLSSGFVTIVSDLLLMLALFATMLWIHPLLTLASFAVLPLTIWGVAWLRKRLRKVFTLVQKQTSRLNSRLAETLSGMGILQSMGCEPWAQEGFDRANARMRRAHILSVRFSSILSAFVQAMSSLAIAAGLLYGGFGLGEGLTVGVLVLFLRYLQRFYGPVEDLANKFSILQRALASAERIFKLLDDERLEPVPAPREVPALREGIRFEKVGFAYRDGPTVLSDIDLEIRPGEKVALVGPTGAGKSTIAKLITRLYEPDSGRITVDGEPLGSFPPRTLRRAWAVVPQDPFLFSRTVAANLRLDRELSEEALERACALVDASSFVSALPRGLDTPLGERGANLSAGERQLLAFARVLAHDPELLILDEATASVDSQTEAKLQRAVQSVLEDRTALVIAHRLATIQSCDRIYVFSHGRVVEQGTHFELLAADGLYARLCRLQLLEERE